MKTFEGLGKALIATCGIVGIVAAGMASSSETADTPARQTQQAPGYFRIPVGNFTVTALYDGFVDVDASLLSGANEQVIRTALAHTFLSGRSPIQTAVNAFLVHTAQNTILVDTGTANLFGPKLGFILSNLRAAGYQPSQIDTVLLTHLHPDHAGGLLTETGKRAFPNAQVFVAKADADYWLNETTAARALKDKQVLFNMSRDALAPYIAAGKLSIFEPGQNIRAGVTAIPAAGHTPGHTAYLFSSKGDSILVWGDIVHNAAVQFSHPEVAIEFDVNKEQAVKTRHALLSFAGSRQVWVAGAHMPFPGIGRIDVDRSIGYRWVPAEYR
jgi:glyoxylase-like metal-dependent hydrolase (beta-lactamase superfamily II)